MNMEMGDMKNKLATFFDKYKRMPSYRELAKLAGFASSQAAVRLGQKLIAHGFLKKSKNGVLVPGKKWNTVHVLGLVEAGFPTPAEEDLLDTLTLDDYLIDNRAATFMLQVKGDSMYDAGIRDGDMVLAERTNYARPGSIVIAEVDGGWTMKYLRKRGEQFYLEPANIKYKIIIPEDSLRIAAVVKAVIRKL